MQILRLVWYISRGCLIRRKFPEKLFEVVLGYYGKLLIVINLALILFHAGVGFFLNRFVHATIYLLLDGKLHLVLVSPLLVHLVLFSSDVNRA